MSIARELIQELHPKLLSHPPGGAVSNPDEADQLGQAEHLECIIAYSCSCFCGKALIPIIAAKIISELGDLDAIQLHELKAAIPYEASVCL